MPACTSGCRHSSRPTTRHSCTGSTCGARAGLGQGLCYKASCREYRACQADRFTIVSSHADTGRLVAIPHAICPDVLLRRTLGRVGLLLDWPWAERIADRDAPHSDTTWRHNSFAVSDDSG